MNGKPEPRFDIDYAFGRNAELHIEEILRWVASGDHKLEVKRKRILDLNFYIETHCDKGRRGYYEPSGINVTTSKVWAFVLGDTGVSVFFPTRSIRTMLDDPTSKDKEESDGNCPTKGKLISLSALLYQEKKRLLLPPQVQVQKESSSCCACGISIDANQDEWFVVNGHRYCSDCYFTSLRQAAQ